MNLENLPKEIQDLAQRELATGRYATLGDLICEALRAHCEQEAFLDANRDEFRERIARGVAQAERGELRDGDSVLTDLSHRIAERRRRGA